MKISLNWIKNYIKLSGSTESIADRLTNTGLEVEGVHEFNSVEGGLDGMVIGEVVEKSKHPNADKLSLTKVDIGKGENLSIVCGAPNVAAGQKVVIATVGATIYPSSGEPFKIKKSKIRGELSEGMICAEDEIGLGDSHDGIMVLENGVEVGTPAAHHFKIETDHIFEIGLTPNRSDAMSHIGVARDYKAAVCLDEKLELTLPDLSEFAVDKNEGPVGVLVEDPDDCIRYSGISISGIKVTASPDWLQNRLKSIGLKPINNVVDITNFVLFETGQPLHAFDQDKIKDKKVIVRKAKKGEKFLTLDEVERELNENDLLICDSEKPMCIAGVFGGLGSGVTEDTTTVFLESACFNSVLVRGTSKRHGLQTDASFRFERGTDPDATIFALKRAAMLLKEIAGAEISSEIVDIYKKLVEHHKVSIGFQNVAKMIGEPIDTQTIQKILEALEIKIVAQSDKGMDLSIPLYRVDVQREADVIEEILRIYGYNRVKIPTHMKMSEPFYEVRSLETLYENLSNFLVGKGFHEILCNSLTHVGDDISDDSIVEILNPLSRELNVMRNNMLYPMLDTTVHNFNHRNENLKFFERGRTYSFSDGDYNEVNYLSILVSGQKYDEHWREKDAKYDIYYLKSILELTLKSSGFPIKGKSEFKSVDHSDLDAAMEFLSNGKSIAELGAVNNNVLSRFDIDKEVMFVNINMDALWSLEVNQDWLIQDIPKFPEVRRDLSMILDKNVSYEELVELAFKADRKLLREVNLFDVYEGDKIEKGKKSYALSFILRDDNATLKEKQIDKVLQRLMDTFEKELNAQIRK